VRAASFVLLALAAAAIPRSALALANPASLFCAQSGGRSENLLTASGAQLGICVLPGGEIVEEWAYFRARHPSPAVPPPAAPTGR
jgi:putative hemolysin